MTVPTSAMSSAGLVNNKFAQAQQAFNTPVVAPAAAPVAGGAAVAPATSFAQPAVAAPDMTAVNQAMSAMIETLLLSLEKKETGPSLAQQINTQEFGRVRPLEKPVKVKSVGISPLSDAE
ncbi:MAG: hypothetical protein VKJ04_03550 [Vampirovibrionales bacterium]|nr:hypothetical protein [Vampirovibrionales bacterium]